MTREDLIKLGGGKVQSNATLSKIYKDYLLEDFGSIPVGCFGCSFNQHFETWKNLVLKNKTTIKNIEIMKQQEDYILKDKNYKAYYKGEFLSNITPASIWVEWLNVTGLSDQQKLDRENRFIQLPIGYKDEVKTEAQSQKTQKKDKRSKK